MPFTLFNFTMTVRHLYNIRDELKENEQYIPYTQNRTDLDKPVACASMQPGLSFLLLPSNYFDFVSIINNEDVQMHTLIRIICVPFR